ncbi:MAG: DUF5682 family protein [Jatrophihabitans sp.]|uniref:DUF5682 family protein n=1 Tax=Jatrophihabitans sp. TaxID=1932789 RepID=UPI003912B61F
MSVAVLGIRHHGPGSARSVVAELERVRPSVVLIEGPSDADPLLGLAADPTMVPPVALLAYDTATPRISAFWPYAVFSPEWQALQWAAANHVPVRFCDLPAGAFLTTPRAPKAADDEPPAEPDADDEDDRPDRFRHVRDDPIGMLATAAGYDDPERWWDDVIEYRLDGQSPFDALTEAMTELRQHTAPPPPGERRREERREAYMRQTLRAALKQTDGSVAVVCGAWHSPALTGPLPPASADAAVLRGMAKRKTTLTWVPWTHSRLAAASGYGAGVTSPGWYHHLFTAPNHVVTRWLTRVAGVLRNHDLPVSSAHVIEAVRLAEALASLRGRPLAGLAEVTEATSSVLCEGDETAVAYVQHDLVVGELLGEVPDDAPSVPLEVDLRATARSLRLKIEPLDKPITLDLRKDNDRAKSVLLHRLVTLGIDWGSYREDDVRGSGTFRETWTLRWRPGLSVSIIDAAQWGTTVAAAARAKVIDTARTAQDLRTVTSAVQQVLLSDLPDALPEVLAILEAKAALDVDVSRLMAAVPALVRAVRYGDVRGTDTASMSAVVDALLLRICAGLPAAVTSLSDDAAAELRTQLDAVHQALALHAQTESGPATRERWITTLSQLAERRDLHGLVAGRIVRLLVDAGVLPELEAARRLSAHLSVGVAPSDKAAWAEGFLSGSGLLLVHDRELLAVLDGWVRGLAGDDFLDVLPLLRRTFGEFSPAERSNIADSLKRLAGGAAPAQVADEPVDPERAAGALRTAAAILAGAAR